MNREKQLKELEDLKKKIQVDKDFYMGEGHEELEEIEHRIYLLQHPEYKPLLPIREHIFSTVKPEKKQKSYVMDLLEKKGYSLIATDTYGNEIPITEDAKYFNILIEGKKVGAVSFMDNGKISMFSCNE